LHTFYKIYFQKKNLVINGPIYRISDDFCSWGHSQASLIILYEHVFDSQRLWTYSHSKFKIVSTDVPKKY
jgi:hypothetical protein